MAGTACHTGKSLRSSLVEINADGFSDLEGFQFSCWRKVHRQVQRGQSLSCFILQDDYVNDDQVPPGEQSIGPPLPVSTHLNKIFTERQGGGFTKSGKVNPLLLFQSLGAQGSGTDVISKPSLTPLDLGLDFQKAFRSLGIFCHGFLAGLAFWQLVMVYMMTEAGGEGTMSFLSFYSPLSQPVHFMFYLLTVVCMISILDRLAKKQ